MYVWRVVCTYECVCIKVEVMCVCMYGGDEYVCVWESLFMYGNVY